VLIDSLIFGAIQGLSEFLPISSSGHLALAMHLVDWQDPPLVMSLVVHVGTLAAVLVLYGRDLWRAAWGGLRLVRALGQGRARQVLAHDADAALALWVVVATVPTGVVALLLRGAVAQTVHSPAWIGALLVVTGLVLLASRWLPHRQEPLTLGRALLVGLAQGAAVLPGISRSGATIVTGLALGLARDEAARFSFIASVPAIVGASLLELDWTVISATPQDTWAYVAAGVTSMAVGYGALRLLVGLVRKGSLWYFSIYVLTIGFLALLFVR
jgi:undecaprenyl-diphosphatase